jgi:endothelin-converting enzyme
VEGELPWIISRFYVQEKFSLEAKAFAAQIIADVQNKFSALLGNTTWMADKDRAVAQKKARSAVQKIGYPTNSPDVLDSRSLEEYYRGLNISNVRFAENKAIASLFNT